MPNVLKSFIFILQEFRLDRRKLTLEHLSLPDGISVRDGLERVLRLPSVASKRYLTNKVRRLIDI